MDDSSPRWNRETVGAETQPATAAEPSAGANPPPAALSSRFAVAEELGRGGMGRVVAATDETLARTVAIKQALSDRADDLERFDREVRITAQLEHPSIVPIYDAGRDANGRPYYVMRRLHGVPLAELVDRATTARDRLALVPNVLAAVDAAAFAHARRIIHRDIKPANILVGTYGETLLIDWGIARELDAPADAGSAPATDDGGLTQLGRAIGTPGYMAPEQARGELVDERADVYALGATLLHVLSAHSPYDGRTPTEWIARAIKGIDPQPMIARIGPEVPAELVAIVAKAMGPQAERYRDARELAADLRAFLAGQLVAAHSYTTRERIARFVRRHRVAVTIAAVAVLVLAIGGVLAIQNVMRERDAATAARLDATAKTIVAADQQQRALLDRASKLVARDPTRVIAMLRELPRASPHLQHARDLAAAAAAYGIARGSDDHGGLVRILEVSPDGGSLLSGATDKTILIHDLAGRSRALATGVTVYDAVWTDGGATVTYCTEGGGLHVIDVKTRATRTLDPAVKIDLLWAAGGDRVRYLDRGRQVIGERSTATTSPERILARAVRQLTWEGDRVLYVDDASIRIVDGDRERVVAALPPGVVPLALALSPDGTRAAVGATVKTLEWDVATGQVTTTWSHGSQRLFYVDTLLNAQPVERPGLVQRLLAGGATFDLLSGPFSGIQLARTLDGVAVVTTSGSLHVVTAASATTIPHDRIGTRSIGARPGSPIIAIGSANGEVMWWDLRDVLPRITPGPKDFWLCALDGERIYGRSSGTPVVISRATGEVREIADVRSQQCVSRVVGSRFVVWGLASDYYIVDGATGQVEPLQAANVYVSRTTSSVLGWSGDTVREWPSGRAPSVVRWSGAGDVRGVVEHPRWFVVALQSGAIVRTDRLTGARKDWQTTPDFDAMEVTPDGTVWIARGRTVLRTDAETLRPIATLRANIVAMIPLGDAAVMVQAQDRSLWLFDHERARNHAGPAADRQIWFGERTVATSDGGSALTLWHLDTGERFTRTVAGLVNAVAFAGGDRTIVVRANAMLHVFTDPVLGDPARLHEWLDSATNAALDPTSDVLDWR